MEQQQTTDNYLMIPVTVLTANAAFIAYLAVKFSPLVAAKILLIEIMLVLGLICLLVFIFRHRLSAELADLEKLAFLGRDEAALLLRQGRASLYTLRQRLEETSHPHKGHEDHVADLVRNVVPIIGLFINKEKDLLRWGMFGWRIASNAIRLMNQRRTTS